MSQTMNQLRAFFRNRDDLKVFAMNGSKVNKNIPDDIFKDYDVVFFSTNFKQYIEDSSFLDLFGETLIKTEPESDPICPNELLEGKGYVYLVQYVSGLRIDFQFRDIDTLDNYLKEDSLTQIIEDKEKLVTSEIMPNDSDYWLKKPSKEQIEFSIAEFWWLIPNILKSSLRKQEILAQFYFNLTRKELFQLIAWSIANETTWNENYGKEFSAILDKVTDKERQQIMSLFQVGTTDSLYKGIQTMMSLQEEYLKRIAPSYDIDLKKLLAYQHIPYTYLMSKDEVTLAKKFK
ncbi:aminoglycoside 6-adenylyltransferase [Vagococcus carniphilus]|uniref:Aminoglycoside 6-adenylyltransferase n=1 Tax=Vagococcus carniphilus TaxID=218144 RepID=A0A430B597_9ENTE|nr:aminoglycoside 6-adenylyltransferase [Vagococcus carniphilus]QNN71902.1 aminoglycoside 6-adenylyltransferase [Vagococcus carniphilus]RSU15469.1 hypothetical protein CBF28_07005 [Vagococcus carniphilus]